MSAFRWCRAEMWCQLLSDRQLGWEPCSVGEQDLPSEKVFNRRHLENTYSSFPFISIIPKTSPI